MTTVMSHPETTLVIERKFKAPKSLVFDVLTKPEHFKNWSSPPSHEIIMAEGDLKVGGAYKFTMQGKGSDAKYTLAGEYLSIEKPNKVVYTQHMLMPNGQTSPNTEISITLEEEGELTKMIFVHSGFPNKEQRDMSGQGWPGAFNKLEEYITSLQS